MECKMAQHFGIQWGIFLSSEVYAFNSITKQVYNLSLQTRFAL